MTVPFGSFPFDAAGVDNYAHPQCVLPLPVRAPTTNDIYPVGTIWCDTFVTPRVLYMSAGGGVWDAIGSGAGAFTALTVTGPTTLTGTTNINTTGAAATSIGTGGTGVVNIGNTTGNTIVTGNETVTGSITSTSGPITASNGNLVFGTAGNKVISTSVGTTTAAGANSFGTVTLVGGTATVATTSVTAASLIQNWRQNVGASTALGILTIGTITPGVSFVISAATQGTPGTPLAADVSVVGWEIIN